MSSAVAEEPPFKRLHNRALNDDGEAFPALLVDHVE
jgi:hypothetical protein